MDVISLLREHEPEIKKRFGVATIGILGSFIRGEERPDSDVDVLITFRRGKKNSRTTSPANSTWKTSLAVTWILS
jgi:predicted nucleotidyltransferase